MRHELGKEAPRHHTELADCQNQVANQQRRPGQHIKAAKNLALAPDKKTDKPGRWRDHSRKTANQYDTSLITAEKAENQAGKNRCQNPLQEPVAFQAVMPNVQEAYGENNGGEEGSTDNRNGEILIDTRGIRPEPLEQETIEVELNQPREYNGQHIPEVGGVAHDDEEEKIIERHRNDDPQKHRLPTVGKLLIGKELGRGRNFDRNLDRSLRFYPNESGDWLSV